jgi:hypothetical protein
MVDVAPEDADLLTRAVFDARMAGVDVRNGAVIAVLARAARLF